MTCTGLGVSISVRRIREPVTSTRCSGALAAGLWVVSVVVEVVESWAMAASGTAAQPARARRTARVKGFCRKADCDGPIGCVSLVGIVVCPAAAFDVHLCESGQFIK